MKKNTIIVKVFCCILFISSCSQNDVVQNEPFASKSLILNPSNSLNPYDYYGVIHNEVMDEFVYTTELNYLSSIKDVASEMDSLLMVNSSFIENFDENTNFNTGSILKPYVEGFLDNLSTIASGIQAGSNAKSYLNNFLNHIKNVLNGSEISHSTMHNYIIALENTVLNDTTLVDRDRELVLATLSISRHSFHYWHTYQSNVNNVAKKNPYKWWQWAIIGAADIIGDAAGATVMDPTLTTTIAGASAASGLGFLWMDHVSDRK